MIPIPLKKLSFFFHGRLKKYTLFENYNCRIVEIILRSVQFVELKYQTLSKLAVKQYNRANNVEFPHPLFIVKFVQLNSIEMKAMQEDNNKM